MDIDKNNIQLKVLEKIYGKVSPFEFKNRLISLAEGQGKKSAHSLLDAGRGNPNWTAAAPREAFFVFGQFAVEETRKVWNEGDLAGMPHRLGIAERLNTYIENHREIPGVDLLKRIIEFGITEEGFNPDDWVFELADGIIGDNYPVPDRMLIHIEKVVHDYLVQEFCYNTPPNGKFKLFAVEGATGSP